MTCEEHQSRLSEYSIQNEVGCLNARFCRKNKANFDGGDVSSDGGMINRGLKSGATPLQKRR
jgi:hypothetical protein